ncbi:phasin family protein [Micromonospora sp. STR1s_5]|nr:phasin family protein [Micromonospora sp. STR1s_5]
MNVFHRRKTRWRIIRTGTQTKNEQINKAADTARAAVNIAMEQGGKANETLRDGLTKAAELHDHTAERTKQMMQSGVEAASQQAMEASDRLTRTLGFSGEGSERLAAESKQNMEVVNRCGTVLTQAFQDTTRSWFELSQKQWKRNLEGLNRLARVKSVQEFAAVQSELLREGLQEMVNDSRAIAEGSLRAVDQANKAFSTVAPQSN